MSEREKILVDKESFLELIEVLNMPFTQDYRVRELQAIKDIPNTPLYILNQELKQNE